MDRSISRVLILATALLFGFCIARADTVGMPEDLPGPETTSDEPAPTRHIDENWRYNATKGLEYLPPRSNTALWLGMRLQARYDTLSGDLVDADELRVASNDELELRRGRLKGGGTLFADWFRVYSEYDFTSNTLLDIRFTTTWHDWLSFRIGQWKSEYNRERIDSSGKQQLAERSISTYWFTIDRQQGIATSGRFFEGRRADTRVYLEYLSGQGRGGSFDGGHGLWLTRVQWNPAGTELPFSQSDLKRRQKATPSIAFAIVDGTTPHTRFSSGGGGNLPGFDQGDYALRQYLFETAVHYRGLGWQQELHYKRIRNRSNEARRAVFGGYAQLGSFLNEWWTRVPAPVELVGRVAVVDPDRDAADDLQVEYTLGINWFFQGHRNKLTADWSFLDYDDPAVPASKWRFRLQWELSL